MNRYFLLTLGLMSLAIPSRAANRPRVMADHGKAAWTSDDLSKLPGWGPTSGARPEAEAEPTTSAAPYGKTEDDAWYAAQAANLRHELQQREAQLRQYRQALNDARSLRKSTGGINVVDGDVAVTPEAGVAILQRRVREAEAELDALEDLARRNAIPPGVLRGR